MLPQENENIRPQATANNFWPNFVILSNAHSASSWVACLKLQKFRWGDLEQDLKVKNQFTNTSEAVCDLLLSKCKIVYFKSFLPTTPSLLTAVKVNLSHNIKNSVTCSSANVKIISSLNGYPTNSWKRQYSVTSWLEFETELEKNNLQTFEWIWMLFHLGDQCFHCSYV